MYVYWLRISQEINIISFYVLYNGELYILNTFAYDQEVPEADALLYKTAHGMAHISLVLWAFSDDSRTRFWPSTGAYRLI